MISEINLTPTSSQSELALGGGEPIPIRSWGSPKDCKAVALLVHGLGAHSGWFEALARQLKIRGFYSISYDLIGFGKRRNAPFWSYSQWLDDLIRIYDHLKEIHPDKQVYLMGNSMGGLLSLAATEFISPDGLVLFSPGFDGYPRTFTNRYRITTIVNALLRPEQEVGLPYGCDIVTRDQPTRNWIENDPDRRFRVPGKMMLELLKLSKNVLKNFKSMKAPVLMLTAGKDQIVSNSVNMTFFAALNAPHKKRIQFEDAWHDLMFDPVIDEVADEIVIWMDELKTIPTGTGSI